MQNRNKVHNLQKKFTSSNKCSRTQKSLRIRKKSWLKKYVHEFEKVDKLNFFVNLKKKSCIQEKFINLITFCDLRKRRQKGERKKEKKEKGEGKRKKEKQIKNGKEKKTERKPRWGSL